MALLIRKKCNNTMEKKMRLICMVTVLLFVFVNISHAQDNPLEAVPSQEVLSPSDEIETTDENNTDPAPEQVIEQPGVAHTFSLSGEGYEPVYLDVMETPYSFNQRYKAKKAILSQLTLHEDAEGGPVYIRHCRETENGCEARIELLVDHVFRAARETETDPWLILAIALYKTNFNPFDVGTAGVGGIMGLRPYEHRNLRFINDSHYRDECRTAEDACQEEVISTGVQVFLNSADQCGGDVTSALRHYISNSCDRNSRFAAGVIKVRQELLEIANGTEDVEWCNPPRPICNAGFDSTDPIEGLDLDF